jgi:hypothetical protein
MLRIVMIVILAMYLLNNTFANDVKDVKDIKHLNSSSDSIQNDTIYTVFINANIISSLKTDSIFTSAYLELSSRLGMYDSINTGPKTTLDKILNKTYNMTGLTTLKSSEMLKYWIKENNNLNEGYAFRSNQTIHLPIVPQNPANNSDISYSQVYDYVNFKSYVASLDDLTQSEKLTHLLKRKVSKSG